MSKLKLFKRITMRDKDGNLEYDSGLKPTDSYVIAFLEFVHCQFKAASTNIEDVNNVVRGVREPDAYSGSGPLVNAGDNNDNYGIVVGTGTTTETNTDYKLATQIAHGTGAGQLDYGAHSFVVPTVVGDNVDMVISRDFYNDSGDTITVKEIGVYAYSKYGASGNSSYFCIARDVLDTPVSVDDTKTLTIQYTFRTTV